MPTDTLQLITKIVKSKDGTEIYAEACGDHTKPHVVFVHGLACAGTVFDRLFSLPKLQCNMYLVRYDARGHARSGKPITAEAYESARYSEDFDAVCNAFMLDRPFFAGWSLAGAIAADICANHNPVPISGIIWIAALPHFGDIMGIVATPKVLSFLTRFLAPNSVSDGLKARVEFCQTLVAPKNLATVPFADMTSWIGASTHLYPECGSLLVARQQDASRLKEEGAKGLPLCIISGEEDLQVIGKNVIENMQPQFKDCEAHLLPELGHILFWEDPNLVGDLILKFVARVTQQNACL